MNLFYREKGQPGFPPLILLHGLWGASDNWLPIAGILSTQFHVFLPDLRNHGHSFHHPVHHYNALSEDIEDFITGLHLPVKPFLAGHSMGGKALMLLLLKRPEIARKATIIDICPKSYSPTEFSLHQQLLDFTREFPLHSYSHRDDIHQQIRQQLQNEDLCQILFKNLQKKGQHFGWKVNLEALHNNLHNLMTWPELPHAHPYPYPILFIKGEKSGYITISDIPLIQSLFPAAELTVIPGTHHHLHAETPATIARTIAHFLLAEDKGTK